MLAKHKRGRPAKPRSAKAIPVGIRLAPADARTFKALARAAECSQGQLVTAWIRESAAQRARS